MQALSGLAVAVVLALLLLLSISHRTRRYEAMLQRGPSPIEGKESPLGNAIRDFAAVAGGIYMSLEMVVSFLRLEVPESVTLMGVEFDPVAAVSLLLAIVHPFIGRRTS